MSDDPNDKSGEFTALWNNRAWATRPVEIQAETFVYSGVDRYRPKTLSGYLRHQSSPARDIKVVSLANCSKVVTWNAWAWDPEEDTETKRDYDKGHLIALSLGGPDHPMNCAPMLHGGNLGGDWSTLEKSLAKALPGRGPSKLVYKLIKLSLTLSYGMDGNDDPRIPTKFGVSVTFCDADGKPTDAAKVEDPGGEEWPNPYIREFPQTNPPERTNTLYLKLASEFQKAEKDMALDKKLRGEGACQDKEVPYKVLHAFHLKNKALENELWNDAREALGVDQSGKYYLPVNPYEFQKGGGISRAQRLLMLCYNRWKTGGTVQSDVESTVEGNHLTFSEHKVEIDHKDPSGKAGDNTYGNLQIASRQWNNKKRDKKMIIG